MSKRVGIVGAGVTPFKGTWREKTYYELAQMATREAVKDAQIEISDVDSMNLLDEISLNCLKIKK